MRSFDRRTLLTAMGVGLTSPLVSPVQAQDKPAKLTVAAYGGIFETAMQKTFSKDFTSRTGIPAQTQLGNPNQWVSQIEASPAKPPLDVVLSSLDIVVDVLPKNLFDPVSVEKLPNMRDVPPFFLDPCQGMGVCFDYGCAGIAYHKGRVRNPPKSLHEFVDRTARGEWTASLSNVAFQPSLGNVVWSLNDAYGGKMDDITPALDAVKRMKKNTIFWSGVTDFLNQLGNGDADIGIYVDGRVWAAYDAGATWIDFVNPTEGAVNSPIAALKPKNASPYAWDYINAMLAPGPQGEFAEIMNCGMSNTKVVYSEKVKSRITPWEKSRLLPFATMGKYIPNWVERWNKEIGT